jgi:hypothetical protein
MHFLTTHTAFKVFNICRNKKEKVGTYNENSLLGNFIFGGSGGNYAISTTSY